MEEQEVTGVPASPSLASPSGLSPASGSSQSGIANAGAFTPGPWRVEGERDVRLGQRVAATVDGTTFTICYAETPLQGGHARHDMREANAALIAAAPELLEALQGLLGDVSRPGLHRMERVDIDRAIAAITKAKAA